MSAAGLDPTDVDVKPTPRFEDLEVDPHFPDRWSKRADRPQLDPKVAWLEAIPVDYPSAKPPADRARYHEVTETILLAEPNGRLVTCIPLEDRSQDEQRYVRNQLDQ